LPLVAGIASLVALAGAGAFAASRPSAALVYFGPGDGHLALGWGWYLFAAGSVGGALAAWRLTPAAVRPVVSISAVQQGSARRSSRGQNSVVIAVLALIAAATWAFVQHHADTLADRSAAPLPAESSPGSERALLEPGAAGAIEALKCDYGALTSCVDLALYYQNHVGLLGTEAAERAQYLGPQRSDPAHAARLFARGCDGGESRGCYYLSLLYARGVGVTRDPAQAEALRTKACSTSSPSAQLAALCKTP
jgi:hypothetical protein